MADPHWTSYVGMATGIIGAITGFVGYRKANSIKSLDLRLALRKSINLASSSVNQLNELVDKANGSRIAVAAARGLLKSSATEKWKIGVGSDKSKISEISYSLPPEEENYKKYSPEKLETKLAEIHNYQLTLNGLIEKYNLEIEKDDGEREHIRQAHLTRK